MFGKNSYEQKKIFDNKSYIDENDNTKINAKCDELIIIQKNIKNHIPLKERLKNYNQNYKAEEWDTGRPVGDEIF